MTNILHYSGAELFLIVRGCAPTNDICSPPPSLPSKQLPSMESINGEKVYTNPLLLQG